MPFIVCETPVGQTSSFTAWFHLSQRFVVVIVVVVVVVEGLQN